MKLILKAIILAGGRGKRLRPIMAMAISLKTGGDLSKILKFALAIELIHTSSLIIDDLPCMDNDFFRRGSEFKSIFFIRSS